MRHNRIEKIDDNPNWQSGDIALCVRGGRVSSSLRNPWEAPEYPKKGAFYTVVAFGDIKMDYEVKPALWFKDGPQNHNGERVWAAYRFIKVTPPEDMVDDQETIVLEEQI